MEDIKNTRKIIFELVNNVMNMVRREERNYYHLLNCLLRETLFGLGVSIEKPLEEDHMHWTTYKFFNCWFQNYKINVVDLCF